MPAIDVPSLAGDTIRWNNRNYIAVDDGGTLVWEHDHDTTRDNWYYIRDYADELSAGEGLDITNRGNFEFEDSLLQTFMSPLIPGGAPTWTYGKPYNNRLPYMGASGQDVDQTDTANIATLYQKSLTDVVYTAWIAVNLVASANVNIIAIGEQAAPNVTEYDQLPLPLEGDECDSDGRHLWGIPDGTGKVVWEWNFRAYAAVEEFTWGNQKYLKFGNLSLNFQEMPNTPGGPKNHVWSVPYDSDVEPVAVGSAIAPGLRRSLMHYFDYPDSGVDDHLGITYKQFAPNGGNSTAGCHFIGTGPEEYPYTAPLRWPVPNFLGEKFHYRGRDYIATDVGAFLAWEMDADALVRIATEHTDDGTRVDLNQTRIIGGRTIQTTGERTEVFPFSGFADVPKIVVSTRAPFFGNPTESGDDQWTASQTTAPTETQFTSVAWRWFYTSASDRNSEVDYVAIGTLPDALIAKLIAGWTLDGSGSVDKVEVLGSGWDFRSAGSATSQIAVKNYGAQQDSLTDPATDKWFNLETLAWHNSGNAYFDGNSDFGISFWFYPHSTGTGTVGAVLSMSDDGSPIEIIYDDDTGTTINLQLHDTDTSVYSSPTVAVVVDTWNFLYFGWTSSTKTISVILNGTARQSSVVAVTLPFEELNDGEPLTLLRRTDDTQPVRGALDELYLWSADLTDNEVSERLYNGGLGKQGPTF